MMDHLESGFELSHLPKNSEAVNFIDCIRRELGFDLVWKASKESEGHFSRELRQIKTGLALDFGFYGKHGEIPIYSLGTVSEYSSVYNRDPAIAKAVLGVAEEYIGVFSFIASHSDGVHYAVGDVYSFHSACVFPYLTKRKHFLAEELPLAWLNYYGSAATVAVGRKVLLGIPAFEVEAVGEGVLVRTLPVPSAYIPSEAPSGEELTGLAKELSIIGSGRKEQSEEIKAYFKKHGILEKLKPLSTFSL